MKEYFNFNLKAQKLLPVWLIFLVVFMVPYVYLMVNIKDFIDPLHPTSILGFYGIMFVIVIFAYALLFYVVKLTIEGIEFKGTHFVFDGTFGQFIGKFILGTFLSVITLGIYSPWFITKMQKFFVNHTSHESKNLEFAGSAGKLFKIFLFSVFLPMLILIGIMVVLQIKNGLTDSKLIGYYTNGITLFIMIPYMYFFYKWMVNVKFKEYAIRWETGFWNSCGKILLEIILSIITIGIFYPLAILRLYQYFLDRTFAVSESHKKGFGYDLEAGKDFLFIWGQLLLILVTLGVYYPWSYCKINSRILSKTYTEQIAAENE